MKRFPAKFVAQRIDFENSWWKTGDVGQVYSDRKKRSFFPLFYKKLSFEIKKSIVLFGAKRVGKTTFIYQTIQELINNGFKKQNIVYFSLENPIYYRYKLNEIIEILFYQRSNIKTEPYIFFFDKIQYYANWQSEIIELVKDYPNIKFVFTGSMSNMKMKELKEFEDFFYFFRLPTLTFFEYVNLMYNESFFDCEEASENCNLKVLDKYFKDYLKFGGHPELLNTKKQSDDAARLLRNRILNRFTLKAYPRLAGISQNDEINAFVAYLMLNTGKITSNSKISEEIELPEYNVIEYLKFLQEIFFIKILKPFKKLQDDEFKVYIANPSYISAVFDFESIIKQLDYNQLVESAILAQWEHTQRDFLYQYDEQYNITFISISDVENIDWCTVVNYSGNSLQDMNKFTEFCENVGIYFPIVTTKNKLEVTEANGLIISHQPSSLYCYQIGRHIIESQLIED
ncbi:MAG: ATP-binding protein [Bacteroidales bacterium]|nr:ATP-binding protein [Bacteroidales bacterium]